MKLASGRLSPGIISSIITLAATGTVAVASEAPKIVRTFLSAHCRDCHSNDHAEADLNLDKLNFHADDATNRRQWVEIYDRVSQHQMPPQDAAQPNADRRAEFVEALAEPLLAAERRHQAVHGRGVVRRLNRSEFETALSDLLQMPLHVQAELPEDAKGSGFDTVGAALNVSSVQMDAYLNVLDDVLQKATTLYEQPPQRKHRLTYREEGGIMQVYRRGGPFHIQDDGVAFFATEKFSHLNAVMSQWTAPHAGRYKVKLSAYAVRSTDPIIVSLRAGGTGHAESNHVPHVFLDHFSVVEGEPQVFEWDGWLERGHYFHVCPTSLRPMRFAGPREEMTQADYEGPGAVIQWVEVDGPIFDQWPPASHKAFWGNTPTVAMEGVKPNADPIAHLDQPPARIAKPKMTRIKVEKKTGNKWKYDPDQKVGGEPIHRAAGIPKPLHATQRFAPTNPQQAAAELIQNFAARAFRRPVEPSEIKPFIELAHRWLADGRSFEQALSVAYKAILTSPGFLYHQGSLPGRSEHIDQHALAERLAFFLWNGLPDDRLLQLANTSTLNKPDVLRGQVDRLLNDPRSDRFLKQFLGQWLDLHLIDFTVPDEKLYPEFDKLLQWSLTEETHGFVRRLIDEDLPARNIVDSDFAMVNWRLAQHYQLPAVEGMHVRSCPLPEDSVRGGLLTQGSVLKVTANGTTTSPVVRGVWLLERILGMHPDPPPPGVPAIEPDIRGATTVREQLEKHRSVASCAACHQHIDPPGVALESFDVIGGWRDHYRAINEELEDLQPKYSSLGPPPIRYVQGPPVDASNQLADGQSFEDIKEFKALLLADERQIARGITRKLLTYSTGAAVSFADRQQIERILDRCKPQQYGLRCLIHEVVRSPMFQQK